MLPPPLPHQIEILQRVADRVAVASADGGVLPLVVFGLDGAICDTRPRTHQILMEFADETAQTNPEVSVALKTLRPDRVHYLLRDTLRECNMNHPEVVRDITKAWRERFYSDDYVRFDTATPGAPKYLRSLHAAGAGIVYVTGRDAPGMLLGTVSSLRLLGFPVAEPRVQLVMKPDGTLGDEAFKREVIPSLAVTGDVIAFFDSDPTVCSIAQNSFANAEISLVDTRDRKDLTDMGHIRDFRI